MSGTTSGGRPQLSDTITTGTAEPAAMAAPDPNGSNGRWGALDPLATPALAAARALASIRGGTKDAALRAAADALEARQAEIVAANRTGTPLAEVS